MKNTLVDKPQVFPAKNLGLQASRVIWGVISQMENQMLIEYDLGTTFLILDTGLLIFQHKKFSLIKFLSLLISL